MVRVTLNVAVVCNNEHMKKFPKKATEATIKLAIGVRYTPTFRNPSRATVKSLYECNIPKQKTTKKNKSIKVHVKMHRTFICDCNVSRL